MESWKCDKCGYTLEADTPPDKCPSCDEICQFLNTTCYTPDCEGDGIDQRIGQSADKLQVKPGRPL